MSDSDNQERELVRQSEAYKYREQVDRLHDVIGADIARDALKMIIVDTTDPIPTYSRGTVTVDKIQEEITTQATGRDDVGDKLEAAGTITMEASAPGADTLRGRIEATGSYSVEVVWLDDDGNELFRDLVTDSADGGTVTDFEEGLITPDVNVIISDDSGTDNSVTGVVYLA